jgi:hypothetical protein
MGEMRAKSYVYERERRRERTERLAMRPFEACNIWSKCAAVHAISRESCLALKAGGPSTPYTTSLRETPANRRYYWTCYKGTPNEY